MPLNQNYEAIVHWSCEAGCQWICELVSIETSPLFLKLKYQCPTCHSVRTRYYDLQRRGYVDAAGVRLEGSHNERAWVDRRPCANSMTCPVKEVTRHIKKGLEVEDFIDAVASAAAKHCPGMNDNQLPRCFVTLFGLDHLHSLVGRFREVYRRAGEPPDPGP
jgi:hypothetical protein